MTDSTNASADDAHELDQLLEHAGVLEPTATQRAVARSLYGLYTALVNQGFNEESALAIVTSTIQVTMLTS